MITLKKEILGINVAVNVVDSLTELTAACGSDQRAIALANNHVLAHSHFAKLRKLAVESLEKLSGLKRVKPSLKEKGKGETEDAFVDRVITEKGEDWFDSQKAALSTSLSAIAVDYQAKIREAVASKPAKKYFDMIAQGRAAGTFDAWAARYQLDFSDCETEEQQDYKAAAFVRDLVLRKQREAKKAAMSEVGLDGTL
jgi:hypothetical protein